MSSLLIVTIGGVMMGIRTTFDPLLGSQRLIFAFEAVIIGGMGSSWGTLLGGIILGLAQTLGAQAFGSAWSILVGHMIFVIILACQTARLPSEDGDDMTSAATTLPPNKRFTVWVANRTNLMIGIFGLLIVIVLALFPIFAGTPWTRRLVDFFTLLALAQFWNLMLGYAGLISVGQQGFIGIGSYTLWLFADILHINPFISVIFAAIGGAIIAFPAALPGVQAQRWLPGHRYLGHRGDPALDRRQHQADRRRFGYHHPGRNASSAPRSACPAATGGLWPRRSSPWR